MTPHEIEVVVRGLYESFNLRDLDRIDAVAISGAELEWPAFDLNVGLREAWTIWATGFPDAQVTVERVDLGQDAAVARVVGRGTHQGPLRLPSGLLHPTHRVVALRLTDTFVMDPDEGKIARGRSEFDVDGLFAQLGVARPKSLRGEPQQAEFHWGY